MLGKLFFSTGPKWIDSLFALRNKIVKFFGLKVSNSISERGIQLKNFKCQENDQIGLFKVFLSNENEVVLGENDKHLDFRVSLFLKNIEGKNNKELTISTLVRFNNLFGKLYFIPVKPFHSFIVPSMLKSIVQNLQKEV